MGIYQQ